MKQAVFSFAVVVVCAAQCRADELTLRSGEVVRGRVLKRSLDSVQLELATDGSRRTVRTDEIGSWLNETEALAKDRAEGERRAAEAVREKFSAEHEETRRAATRAVGEAEAAERRIEEREGQRWSPMVLAGIALVFVVGLWLYLLPYFVASRRKVPASEVILVVNLLFGWTALGWFALLLIAFLAAPAERPREPRRRRGR